MNTEPWVTAIDVAQHLGIVKAPSTAGASARDCPRTRFDLLWKFQLSEICEWVRAGGTDDELGSGDEQK
jgi:hypothetical protein